MRPTVQELWRPIVNRAEAAYPALGGLRLVYCLEADREHEESERQYAHVTPEHGFNTVCVAHAFDDLRTPYQLGILVHEIGHLLGNLYFTSDHSEDDANTFGQLATGIHVVWRGPHRLEYSEVPAWLKKDIVSFRRSSPGSSKASAKRSRRTRRKQRTT